MSSLPAPVEDPERTTRIRARDAETLQQVVHDHLPMLLRAARAAGLSPDQAEDAVQETFLTFLTRAHDFDGRARVRTWLYGILLRKTSHAFAALRRSAETETIDEVVEARYDQSGRWARPPQGPDAGADAERVRAWLTECLETVPARRRLAFVLKEVEELPVEEVCKVLEITPNNLGVLLFRARNGLRECLETKGLRSRDDAQL